MSDFFSRTLRYYIEISKLSYAELEKKSGIPKSAIQRYASGTTDKVPIDRVEKLANALGVETSVLMGWKSGKGTTETLEDPYATFRRMLTYYMGLNNVTQNELARQIGVNPSTLNSWILGKTEPRINKIEEIANYFGVEKSVLLEEGGLEEYYINKDAADMAEWLHQNPEYRVLFDASKKVKKEDIEKVKAMIDLMSDNKDEY